MRVESITKRKYRQKVDKKQIPEYVFEVFNLARPAATVEGGCRFAFELPVLSCPIRGLGFPPNFGGIPYPGNGREEGGLTFE
jgi:hypothetical protein